METGRRSKEQNFPVSDTCWFIQGCTSFCAFLPKGMIPKPPFRPKMTGEKVGCDLTDVWLRLWLVLRIKHTACLFYAYPLPVSKMEGTQSSLLAYAHILRWHEQL